MRDGGLKKGLPFPGFSRLAEFGEAGWSGEVREGETGTLWSWVWWCWHSEAVLFLLYHQKALLHALHPDSPSPRCCSHRLSQVGRAASQRRSVPSSVWPGRRPYLCARTACDCQLWREFRSSQSLTWARDLTAENFKKLQLQLSCALRAESSPFFFLQITCSNHSGRTRT